MSNYANNNNTFDYPIIWIPTKWYPETTPNGSILRNNHFLLAHCGFFFFNFINVVCILLFHGFVLRRLKHNFLMKMALVACFGQMISCMCSIHRYNTNDEYGNFAHASIGTGLVGYTFFNYVILHLVLNVHRKGPAKCSIPMENNNNNNNNNQTPDFAFERKMPNKNNNTSPKRLEIGIGYMTIGMTIWILIAIACWVVGRARWETDNFKHFRDYISLSTLFQFVSYIIVLRAFSKKKIALPENHPISDEVVVRVLIAAIGLILFAFACAVSAMPVFQYPATGMTFSVMVFVVSVVGEMDFMTNDATTAMQDEERGMESVREGISLIA